MRFRAWEGPSRGLLRDCTTSPINRLQLYLVAIIVRVDAEVGLIPRHLHAAQVEPMEDTASGSVEENINYKNCIKNKLTISWEVLNWYDSQSCVGKSKK